MINRNRLAETFKCLVEIDSVSKEEGAVCSEIRKILVGMDAETVVDSAGDRTGSNTGNLIAKFPSHKLTGNMQIKPLLLNAHMDTVEPGRGINAVLKDGNFTSSGATILGADDKSAIAVILETLRVLCENDIQHAPLEIVFTICEEIGLLGAKHLDYSLINAKYGYTLDTFNIEGIVTRAPAANKIVLTIHGKDAHAGAEPEKGINAIVLAGQAIAALHTGRIDHETTCNIGIIEGGIAPNIVPKLVTVTGEARSHDKAKLSKITNQTVSSFKQAVDNYRGNPPDNQLPCLDIHIESEFPLTNVHHNHPVVTVAMEAASKLGMHMRTKTTGGGSDANIFFEKGIITGVLGTGMQDVHTVRESIRLDDMVKTAELLLEIIRLHSRH